MKKILDEVKMIREHDPDDTMPPIVLAYQNGKGMLRMIPRDNMVVTMLWGLVVARRLLRATDIIFINDVNTHHPRSRRAVAVESTDGSAMMLPYRATGQYIMWMDEYKYEEPLLAPLMQQAFNRDLTDDMRRIVAEAKVEMADEDPSRIDDVIGLCCLTKYFDVVAIPDGPLAWALP